MPMHGLQGDGRGQHERRGEYALPGRCASTSSGVQQRQQPHRIGHHAVIELHRQRVLEHVAPCRCQEERRVTAGTRLPSISGQVL